VAGLVRSNAPESYAGGTVATVRVSHSRQVKSGDRDIKEYRGTLKLAVGLEAATNRIKSMFW